MAVAVVATDQFEQGPPQHADGRTASITTDDGRTLYVQKFEVTVAEWNRCNDARACSLRIRRRESSTGTAYPATGVNWFDVNEYLTWINKTSRRAYRLPTSQEWQQMAREVMPETPDPLFTDPQLRWASAYLTTPGKSRALRPSGSFKSTTAGIADLNGSVWEWTADCYSKTEGAYDRSNCPAYYVAGEHFAVIPIFTRDPARGGCSVGAPPPHLGLRLVSDSPA